MRKSRFTETQTVTILKVADATIKVGDLCLKHGGAEASDLRWVSEIGA